VVLLWHVVGLVVVESEMWLSGNGSNSKLKSSSTSLAKLAVDCINCDELLRVKAVAVDWLGGQSIIFAVFLVFVVIGIIVSIIVIGIGSRKLSLMSSMTSAVNCVDGCDSWRVEAMAVGLPSLVFLVVVVSLVIRVVFGSIVVRSGIRKSSSTSSASLAIDSSEPRVTQEIFEVNYPK